MYNTRLKKLRNSIESLEIEAILLTNISNIQYISGFSGSTAFLFITPQQSFLATDFRYITQAKAQVTNSFLISYKERLQCIKENI